MRKTLLTILMGAFALTLLARPQHREVVIDTITEAPLETMLQVVEKFCRQFQSCSDSLFEWAYVGLGESEEVQPKTKESRDAIQLRYKERVYDPVLKIGDVAIDIYVLGMRWWKDQHLGTIYHLHQAHYDDPTDTTSLMAHMTATYSGSILEGGDVIFCLTPIDTNHTKVHYEFGLTFGRVLSAFISDKTWRNAIQWRFGVILENMMEYAETGVVSPKERGPGK